MAAENGSQTNDFDSRPMEISLAMMEDVAISLMESIPNVNVDKFSLNGPKSSKAKKKLDYGDLKIGDYQVQSSGGIHGTGETEGMRSVMDENLMFQSHQTASLSNGPATYPAHYFGFAEGSISLGQEIPVDSTAQQRDFKLSPTGVLISGDGSDPHSQETQAQHTEQGPKIKGWKQHARKMVLGPMIPETKWTASACNINK